jgi:hypothetical protein
MDIQDVVCSNVPSKCCITVTIDYPLSSVSGITRLTLTRTSLPDNASKTLIDKSVSRVSDLDITYDDLSVVSGVTYQYTVVMFNSNSTVVRQGLGTAECKFKGISLADEDGSWHTDFGTSDSRYTESYKHTRPIQYINTLAGRFPHRISNGEANYATGSCSGLWVPLSDRCGEPDFTGDVDGYREAFIEWLTNGNEKLLRTGAGKAMIVSIDGDVSENWDANTQLTTVSFSWTQVGEIDKPTYTHDNPVWAKEVITS